MWRHFRCGEILDVEKFYMWRNYTCGEICLISWADMPELLALLCQVKLIDHIIHTVLLWDICLMEYTLFCQKSILLRYTLFSRETCFVAIYALSVWREIMLKMLSVEKKWQISCMVAVLELVLLVGVSGGGGLFLFVRRRLLYWFQGIRLHPEGACRPGSL